MKCSQKPSGQDFFQKRAQFDGDGGDFALAVVEHGFPPAMPDWRSGSRGEIIELGCC
ncbi:MAG: hypothetical protein ACYC38_13235 [Eubacteriales bacterium]